MPLRDSGGGVTREALVGFRGGRATGCRQARWTVEVGVSRQPRCRSCRPWWTCRRWSMTRDASSWHGCIERSVSSAMARLAIRGSLVGA